MTFRDDPAALRAWLDREIAPVCAGCFAFVQWQTPSNSHPASAHVRRWRDFITETPCCSQGFVVRRIADCEWVMARCPRCGDNSESAPLQQVGQNSNTLAE